jgi:hypothetical protein
MQANDFLFFLALVLAFFLILGYMQRGRRKQRRLNEIWREFAKLKGLQEQPTDNDTIQDQDIDEDYDATQEEPSDRGIILSFRGKNQNLPFLLECFATEGTPMQIGKLKMRRGDKIKTFTRIEIGLSNLPKGLRVYRETTWSKLGKAIGMQDITTGDASFDNSFMIKGDDQREILDYLTPSRRMALLTYADKLHGLELQEEGVILLQQGQIDSVEKLDRYFSELGALASALIRS